MARSAASSGAARGAVPPRSCLGLARRRLALRAFGWLGLRPTRKPSHAEMRAPGGGSGSFPKCRGGPESGVDGGAGSGGPAL